MIDMVLLWIIASTFLVSLISLIGLITLKIEDKLLKEISLILVSLSAGALMGGAFFHLIPEAIEQTNNTGLLSYVVLGFITFFILEKVVQWQHCHDPHCDIHSFTYMNLIGDLLHKFIDGLVIAGSFIIDFNLGITTTIAVILHEIPQEMGEFGVLIRGGFSKYKAISLSFLVGLGAILGGTMGYFLSGTISDVIVLLLPFAAGGFIYISSSDLIPEIRKTEKLKESFWTFIVFVLGLLVMWSMALIG